MRPLFRASSRIKIAFFIFLFVFVSAVYAFTLQGVPAGGDAVGMYLVTHAIAQDRTVFPEPSGAVFLHHGRGGRMVSKFGIGQSIAELPLALLAQTSTGRFHVLDPASAYRYFVSYFITSFTSPALALLAILITFLWMGRMGFAESERLFATLCLAFGSLMWSSSKVLMSESTQAAALAVAAYALFRYRDKSGARWMAVASAAMGFLFATKAVMIVTAPVFCIYFFWPGRKSKLTPAAVVAALLPFAVFAAVTLWYNDARFGNPLNFGYYTENNRDSLFRFNVPLWMGLHGLLLSSGKGLLFYCPFILLSLFAWGRFYRERPAEAFLCAAVPAVIALAFAKWNQWHGDFAWGPRFLAPAMPFLAVPIGYYFRDARWPARTVAVGLLALSVWIQTIGVSVNYNEYFILTKSDIPYQIFIHPNSPDFRDEWPNVHYVPEFSPLAGHAWLFRHMVEDRGLDDRTRNDRLRQDFPWKSLMSGSAPLYPLRAEGWDFWYEHFAQTFGTNLSWARATRTAILFIIITSFCGAVLTGFAATRKLNREPDI